MTSKWRSFEESKKWVQTMNLKSKTEWEDFKKLGKKPKDIPSNPDKSYQNDWISWGDWLRSGKKLERKGDYYSYENSRKIIHTLNLKSAKEWRNFCKTEQLHKKIPKTPNQVYENNGWIDWGDWLGTRTPSSRNRKWKKFEDARKFVHSLNLKSEKEWNLYCKSGNKPQDIPQAPRRIYANKWISMGDWLGTGRVQDQKRFFMNFEDARKFVHSLNLKSAKEWQENYLKSGNKPDNIPASPQYSYKRKGWISWGDFLGTRNKSNILKTKQFLPFNHARKFVHSLKIDSQKKWNDYCYSDQKPENIPSNPQQVYKNKGWVNFGDWLGTGRLGPKELSNSFLPFNEAKKVMKELAKKHNIKNTTDWQKFVKSGNKPDNIPSAPWSTYAKNKRKIDGKKV